MGMNPMQQMAMRLHKIQKELEKAEAELNVKEFKVSKNGMVTVTVLGSKEVKSVEIDKDAFDADNQDMVQEAIALALNEAFAQIDKEVEEYNERIKGNTGGMF